MSFLNTKNLSPRTLSYFTALFVALGCTLLSLFFHPNWYELLIVFAVVFLLSYSLYYYTLQRFIYRKIKLIYKFIYQTKATKKEEFFYESLLPPKSIEEVNEDVRKWAAQHNKEIKLLRANEQFRKEFLMNLAHELRTPIFTIQGYVDTLLDGAMDDHEVRTKFLKNASRGIERLVNLVDDLGEISKLESGTTPLLKEDFVIQELISEVFEELALKASHKKMSLQFKKGTEGALKVHADRQKIKQVLINLVENAIKYGNESGVITAGCYSVDDAHAYIEISDNGPGIAQEYIPRIFERFYRADKSRNRDIGGTGLGLAIVKHIVEAHGQTVTVRSKLGVGSSFGFTLDIAP